MIFFLPPAYDGCYYYRGYMPGVYMGESVESSFGQSFDKERMLKKALEADIIVVHRPNEPIRFEIAKLLKQKGKKIIFENDDTYLPDKGIPLSMLTSDKQREIAKMMNSYLYQTLEIADGAIASTEILAEEFRAINSNVRVLKNCIDPLDEQEKEVNDTGKFRIGFVGSVVSNDDYTHVKDQIKKLAERDDVTIVVFGLPEKEQLKTDAYKSDYDFWHSLPNLETHNFVPVTHYYTKIASLKLDLAMIPRKDSYFNRCKSNLKFLEMSLLEIPVIAQGFSTKDGPYDKEADYMTVVYNDNWHDKILEIKNNYQAYADKASKAKAYVLENYNINNYAPKWRETILDLCK